MVGNVPLLRSLSPLGRSRTPPYRCDCEGGGEPGVSRRTGAAGSAGRRPPGCEGMPTGTVVIVGNAVRRHVVREDDLAPHDRAVRERVVAEFDLRRPRTIRPRTGRCWQAGCCPRAEPGRRCRSRRSSASRCSGSRSRSCSLLRRRRRRAFRRGRTCRRGRSPPGRCTCSARRSRPSRSRRCRSSPSPSSVFVVTFQESSPLASESSQISVWLMT